ncbi:MAG: anhydro-N-acetylmuramic acid kinase [Tepidisphaeraceae bacterium]|jgi:anhydro-N-acetylmuramic acid kinase
MAAQKRVIAGAMSGTSADGVDVALVRISGRGLDMSAQLLQEHHRDYATTLRRAIAQIRQSGAATLATLTEVGREISLCYAAAVNETLLAAGMSGGDLAAVAAHGQTLYHHPPHTIQWLDPALIAAEVGCVVISDFRRADCAAGGQGAPLVPLADYLLLRDARKNRVLLNLGGIANLTYLPAGGTIEEVIAFDTGPGNCLSDDLMRGQEPGFDQDGKRAAAGKPMDAIVKRVLAAPYFAKPPPKSTDGPAMIHLFTEAQKTRRPLNDLLCTACVIAAESIGRAVRQFLPSPPDEVIVSGGGTRNTTLMSLLGARLGAALKTIDEFGIASSAKEAMAFALLGAATLDGVAGNVPAATGAKRGVVLGSITPQP